MIKEKSKMKKVLVSILSVVLCMLSLTFLACDSGREIKDGGFKEGYAVKYQVNEEIYIEDLVDTTGATSFTLYAQQEGSEKVKLHDKEVWQPNKIGVWGIELELVGGAKEGSYYIEVEVKAPNITMSYNENRITFRADKDTKVIEVTFETLIEKLKIESNFEQYGEVTKRIYSVRLAEDTALPVKFSEKDTSYTFEKIGDDATSYDVIFGVEASDGQFYKGIKTIYIN